MDIIYNKIFLEHETGNHPESADRLRAFGDLRETKVESGEKYLELFHLREYIEHVKGACSKRGYLDPDTPISEKSYESAIYAVGAAIMASEDNGFALVRPPGHHAHSNRSSGFCLFNNIAIAVQRQVNMGKKVFILDFDGHLGDGTEQFFYNSDKVLYWSLHQYPAFPGGGSVDEIGAGEGRGYTMNVPLPAGSGDDIYLDALNKLMPFAEEFSPDIVAVSAGFDAHRDDPLLSLNLTNNSYYKTGQMLAERFDRIFALLEGGYNINILPKSVYSFIDGINQQEMKWGEEPTESPKSVVEKYNHNISNLKDNLSNYWKS